MAEPVIDDRADGEPGPDKAPKSAKAWLTLIADAEKAFAEYHAKADNIDKMYADLAKLASTSRDRQFQMFWANIQVLGPSVYSRPPVPVVVPRFKDRRPLARTTSEMLERCSVVSFELADIDGLMRLIRDDLTVVARGCAWVRYEAEGENYLTEKVCLDYVDRRDFLHDPARTWREVDWVAKASYLDKKAMRKRFKKHSGDEYTKAAYEQRKDEAGDDSVLKAKVWEIWCKSLNRVVWVSEGCDKLLDEGAPHLTLDGFFPCPQPAYGTVQRRSLIPVPDMLFYKDQLEEINELTARIGALSDAVKVRGFYPAGAGEIGDAIETAVKKQTDNQVLIPVSNWSMVGTGGVKDMIVWLPLDMIAETITQLVQLRKQLIDDVYQITGLSDIMRGSTDASETLGAQELKSQYGSIRIRDRQGELVRIARDITRITAEIMAENFQPKTMLEMSQLEIPTEAEIQAQIVPMQHQAAQIAAQIQQASADPEVQAMAQQQPEKAQQVMAQAQQQVSQLQGQIAKLGETITVEKVTNFLRDERLRPFVLDIETDSTIAPDENATKQRATEYVTAVGGFMNQALPLVQAIPQAAPVVSDVLRFVAAQYRAGRQVEGSIEEFADQMKAVAQQPKEDPEAAKANAEAQAAQMKAQSDAQAAQADAMERQANARKTVLEAESKAADEDQARRIREQEAIDASNARQAELDAKMAMGAQEHAQKMDIGALQIEKLRLEIEGVKVKTDATVAATEAKIEQTNTQTDNSIATTEAGIAAKAKEPEPA